MSKVRRIVGAAGLLAFATGCDLLPSQLQPPTNQVQSVKPPEAEDLADMMTLVVTVNVLGPGEETRSVQYNGGSGALQQDINKLIVGIFDYGATTVPSFGYLFTGNVGAPVAAVLDAAASTTGAALYLASTNAVPGLKNKIGTTSACSGCDFGATGTPANAKDALRRYLIRDYGNGSTWTSNSTPTKFANIPLAKSDNLHKYLVFAAAYDGNNSGNSPALLGYTEVKLQAAGPIEKPDANSAYTMSGTLQLDLKLNESILISPNAVSQTPILTPFVPDITDS